jgi:hypothetical protein
MSSSPYVYRIIEFEHLIDLFKNKSMRLTRPATWEDPYEASLSHAVFSQAYAQCWSSIPVSDAMWRIYSPRNTGVRIRANKASLLSEVRSSLPEGWTSKLAEVEYLSTVDLRKSLRSTVKELQENFSPHGALDSLFLKRSAFAHESEVRLAVYAKKMSASKNFIEVSIDPHKIIASVLVDPRASARFLDIVQYYLLTNVKFGGAVRRSSLYSPIEALRIE